MIIQKLGLYTFLSIFFGLTTNLAAADIWVEQNGKLQKVSDTQTVNLKRSAFRIFFAPFSPYEKGRHGVRVLAYPAPLIWNLHTIEKNGGWLQGMADYNDDEGIMLSEAANFWARGSGLERLSVTTAQGRRFGVRRIDSFYIVGSPFDLPDVQKRFKALFKETKKDIPIERYPHSELYLTVIYDHISGTPVDRSKVVRVRIVFND